MNTRYELIDRNLFIKNRQKFIAELKPNSIAIFNSNDMYPVSSDTTLKFEQHRDIFYLSGVDQEESILILCPNAVMEEHKEMLFLRKTDEHIAVWEGAKLNKEQATQVSGIKNIYWLEELDNILYQICANNQNIYINKNEHYRAGLSPVETREDRFIKKLQQNFPGHTYLRSNPILQRLRSIKEDIELALMQRACDITEKGFRRLLSFVKPEVWEYEIEAEFLHEAVKNRSKGFAYSPIVASGKDSIVLHYILNNKQCKNGELILLDIGAEYANYSSDMSRTIPVNGKYTERQKLIYNTVLTIKNEATKLLVAGNDWYTYHKQAGEVVTEQLLNIGLLDKADIQNQDAKWPAYKKYFMHGASHHLGLDTHDYGLLNDKFTQNMVLTVEPGIYLPEEGFGIRIEDNVVIQNTGAPFNLMKNIPIEAEEIEELMNK